MKAIILLAAALLASVVSPADARARKPTMLQCVFIPYPGHGCPMHERVIGSAGYGTLIGWGVVAAAHVVAPWLLVGTAIGAAGPLVVK